MTPKKTVRFSIRDAVYFCRIRVRPSASWLGRKRTEMNTHNKETGLSPASVQKRLGALAGFAVILFGLYLSSLYNYLLFHTLVELFGIVVGCGIFIVAWNSRRLLDNINRLIIVTTLGCIFCGLVLEI